MMLLDVLLCFSALIPVLIRKEGLIMQGVVKTLGVLLGRQMRKKECEGKCLSSQRATEVILLYHETAPRHSCY